jgi:hypothetical protein
MPLGFWMASSERLPYAQVLDFSDALLRAQYILVQIFEDAVPGMSKPGRPFQNAKS